MAVFEGFGEVDHFGHFRAIDWVIGLTGVIGVAAQNAEFKEAIHVAGIPFCLGQVRAGVVGGGGGIKLVIVESTGAGKDFAKFAAEDVVAGAEEAAEVAVDDVGYFEGVDVGGKPGT